MQGGFSLGRFPHEVKKPEKNLNYFKIDPP